MAGVFGASLGRKGHSSGMNLNAEHEHRSALQHFYPIDGFFFASRFDQNFCSIPHLMRAAACFHLSKLTGIISVLFVLGLRGNLSAGLWIDGTKLHSLTWPLA